MQQQQRKYVKTRLHLHNLVNYVILFIFLKFKKFPEKTPKIWQVKITHNVYIKRIVLLCVNYCASCLSPVCKTLHVNPVILAF